MKNSGLNGFDIAQAVVGVTTVVLTVASIILGHKGNMVRLDQYQIRMNNMQNPPKAA
jgi:hypothetical protein